ncbi:hypothetical protein [Roseicitreum antarcticum]|uniref:hypothetical protein n=1 Tax=Roseicitreum antarcticum TaxID=564137 RepID=UPI001CC1C994|nr:hypothetical protein [Roseicitreum antarcticum]
MDPAPGNTAQNHTAQNHTARNQTGQNQTGQNGMARNAPGHGGRAAPSPPGDRPRIGPAQQGRPTEASAADGPAPHSPAASSSTRGANTDTTKDGVQQAPPPNGPNSTAPDTPTPDDHILRPLAAAGLANLPHAVQPTQAPRPRGRLAPEWLAGFLTALWLAGIALFVWRADLSAFGGLEIGMIAASGVFPLGLIWLGVSVLRAARAVQDDADRLHIAVDAMRQAWLTQQQTAGVGLKTSVEQKLDDIAQAQKQTETALAMFTSTRAALPDRAPRPGAAKSLDTAVQSALALDSPTDTDQPPLGVAEFIRALHFPETAEDTEGFAALRRALGDHATAQLVRAAQEVLTVLAQEGIYMDDLRPDRARPEVWRAFADGAPGAAVAGLGGIRDRSCLALTVGRMRSDPVFRDTAHRFLREFDRCFAVFEAQADDADLARFAETRSARAFMLLGRVTGMFSARG